MADIKVYLSRDTDTHLAGMAERFSVTSEHLVSRTVRKIVEIDRYWRQTGLAGLQAGTVPPAPERSDEDIPRILSLDEDVMTEYVLLCERLGRSPQQLVSIVTAGLADEDREHIEYYKVPLGHYLSKDERALEYILKHAIFCISGNIRPGESLVWSADKPFPLTDAECAALVRGNLVRWGGTMDDFLKILPGKYEMSDGFLLVYET